MFDRWRRSEDWPTLFLIDRPVIVHIQSVFPYLGRRLTGVPMFVRTEGIRLEPYILGRQIAWIRRFDGGYWAIVLVVAHSENRQSQLTMQLWVEPEQLLLDPTGLGHFLDPRTLPPPHTLG